VNDAHESKNDPVKVGDAGTLEAAAQVLAGSSEKKGLARILPFLGPAFIAAVAYVDPGNYATNIQGGVQFGNTLLWVVVASNLMAMLVQALSAKLGIATGLNLAEHCRANFSRPVVWGMWVLMEIVAIAASYLIETVLDRPNWGQVFYHAVVPQFSGGQSVLLAAGILGATVMPHVIFLHSSLTQDRIVARLLPGATSLMLDMSEEGAAALLRRKVEQFQAPDLPITVEVCRGDPALAIVRTAQRVQADVIVLGTHGKAGMDAFWSGSVAPQVASRSRVPLLLVPVRTLEGE
jgi:nucleotide-binding universal stress UspA family protein